MEASRCCAAGCLLAEVLCRWLTRAVAPQMGALGEDRVKKVTALRGLLHPWDGLELPVNLD